MVTYFLTWLGFNILLRLCFRFKPVGTENIPKTGGVILASNHQSFLDPLLVGCGNPRLGAKFMARDTLWNNKWLVWWYNFVGAFPVKRGGADRAAWKLFERYIEEGQQVVMYPEGTRSPDGRLLPINPGSGMLLHRCPTATVIPVRIFGAYKAMPKSGGLYPATISVVYGPPVDLSAEYKMEGSREVYAVMADKVMAAIAALKPPKGRHLDHP